MKRIYVHEIITTWSQDGEVYIETDRGEIITFNPSSLFSTIPSLLYMAKRANVEHEKIIVERIKKELS